MKVETASVTSHGNSKQTEVILRSFMKKCPLGLIHNFPTGYKRHLYADIKNSLSLTGFNLFYFNLTKRNQATG